MAIVKEMTGRNRAAQLEIVKQMSRQESRSSAGPDVQVFVTPRTVTHQAPLSMGFSRQESWSGLPDPPPRDLPDPGTEPSSLVSPALAVGFFTTL